MTTVHLIDGTSREHPGCTGHSEDGRLWITSPKGIGFGDWSSFYIPAIVCASYSADEYDWWTDR